MQLWIFIDMVRSTIFSGSLECGIFPSGDLPQEQQ